jgi:KaiC/GvpD/RAD55 family RecA-like ATPase
MAKANPAQAKLIRSEVARLLTSGSKRRLDVVSAARQEDHDLIVSMLEMEDRGFVTESTIWATNPK